jgi:beta-mannanase
MDALRDIALVGCSSMLFACASSGGDRGQAQMDGGVPAITDSGPADAASPTVDAAREADAATPPPSPYTLTITSPQPNASVSGAINVVGVGPGFLNVEVHSMAGVLLARVTPDAMGDFSAPLDTTHIGNGAETVTIDGWDGPAGGAFMHHATTSLPLSVSNPVSDGGQSCVDANGNGIRYFGAYTKNTQTNYDFDKWSGFHQDFLTSFINCDTWANMAASDWGFQIMSLQPPGENIQEIVCLSTTEDPVLQHVGAGMYDSYIQQIGALFLKYNYPNAFIRLGHEFEGNWYPWGMLGGPNNMDYADFIAAFRHVAGLLKQISPTFSIVWNPGCGYYAQMMDSEKAYPGDDVVDVIGVDCYDDGSGVAHLFGGVYGMNQWAQFAQQHKKPIALPEWGLGVGGDDPAYIQAMFNFMVANPTFSEAFWDSDDGNTQSQLSTGEAPNSGAMFLQTFGQYASACHH